MDYDHSSSGHEHPLVSIIINNYNYAAYVSQAIQSALDQTYDPVEVIVVDDASIDNSREVITAFGERIRYVGLAENRGQGGAMNAGYAASHGEVLFFLDADDLLDADIAQKVVQRFAANPQASKVHFYLRVIDREGRPRGDAVPDHVLPGGWVPSKPLWRERIWSPTSGNAYRRDRVAPLFPIPEQPFRISADVWCNVLSPYIGEIEAIQGLGGSYRLHGSNNYAGTITSADMLQSVILVNTARTAALVKWCEKNLSPSIQPRVGLWTHVVKQRMLSMAILPQTHPIEGDTPWRVFKEGMSTLPGLAITVRLRTGAWLCLWLALFTLGTKKLREQVAAKSLSGQRGLLMSKMKVMFYGIKKIGLPGL